MLKDTTLLYKNGSIQNNNVKLVQLKSKLQWLNKYNYLAKCKAQMLKKREREPLVLTIKCTGRAIACKIII